MPSVRDGLRCREMQIIYFEKRYKITPCIPSAFFRKNRERVQSLSSEVSVMSTLPTRVKIVKTNCDVIENGSGSFLHLVRSLPEYWSLEKEGYYYDDNHYHHASSSYYCHGHYHCYHHHPTAAATATGHLSK